MINLQKQKSVEIITGLKDFNPNKFAQNTLVEASANLESQTVLLQLKLNGFIFITTVFNAKAAKVAMDNGWIVTISVQSKSARKGIVLYHLYKKASRLELENLNKDFDGSYYLGFADFSWKQLDIKFN